MPISDFRRRASICFAMILGCLVAQAHAWASPSSYRVISTIADHGDAARSQRSDGRGQVILQNLSTGETRRFLSGTRLSDDITLVATGTTAILIRIDQQQRAIAIGAALPVSRSMPVSRQRLMELATDLPALQREVHLSLPESAPGLRGIQVARLYTDQLTRDFGILEGDLLQQLNNIPLSPNLNVWELMTELGNEDLIKLKIWRNGKAHTLKYRLH